MVSCSRSCWPTGTNLNCGLQGLLGLQSIEEIEDLTDEDVATYLTRYGITELPTRSSAHLTQRERKNLLRGLVGAPFP